MNNQKLAMVAELMNEYLRHENHAYDWRHMEHTTALGFYINTVNILEEQHRVLREELFNADRIIFEANQRAWELQEQNDLLRERILELNAQLGQIETDPDSTDSEILFGLLEDDE